MFLGICSDGGTPGGDTSNAAHAVGWRLSGSLESSLLHDQRLALLHIPQWAAP
jgi:hypothetical protein